MLTQIEEEKLVLAAREIQKEAYAPYSKFLVGAAVLGEDGVIYQGVNVENASYGLTVCGERTAVFKAVIQGNRRIKGVAIVTSNRAAPCGACRQVLVEFAPEDIPVLLAGPEGEVVHFSLYQLLPEHFGPKDL